MKLFFSVLILVMGIASSAFSRPTYDDYDYATYFSAKTGYSRGMTRLRLNKDKEKIFHTDNSVVEAAIGVQGEMLRTELELSVLGNDPYPAKFGETVYKTKVRVKTYLLNEYIDFRPNRNFRPYLGIGVGMADLEIKYDNDQLEERKPTVMAASAKAGLGIRVAPTSWLDIGYKFLILNKIEFQEKVNAVQYTDRRDHMFHEITVGFRFIF